MSPDYRILEVRREALSASRPSGGVGSVRTGGAAANVKAAAQAAQRGPWSKDDRGVRVEPSRWFG